MRDLKVGDEVLAVTGDDRVTPSRVLTFLHKEDDTDAVYRNIQTDQQTIRLSADHLIFASETESADRVQDIFASKVRPGNIHLILIFAAALAELAVRCTHEQFKMSHQGGQR